MKTVVYQVIRRTNGKIKAIRALLATKKKSSFKVFTPSGKVIAMSPKDLSGTRGRPTSLPNQLVPVETKAGAPLTGTIHTDSTALRIERRVLTAKIAVKNQDITGKLRDSDWLDIYNILENTLGKKGVLPC